MDGKESRGPRRFVDRVALVTGASSGIGLATAKRLAEEGAAVALGARRQDLIETQARALAEAGYRALAAPLDVTDEASVRSAIQRISEAFGRLDVVVANAGLDRVKPFTTLKDADWNDLLQVNLVGAARAVKAAMPLLARRGGSVVMVSSVAGLQGATVHAAYAAAKGGVVALAMSLAKELAPRKIRVNVVAPGMVRTDMFDRISKMWTPEHAEEMEKAHPLGFGEPDDVAAAIAYLASGDARWVTGSVLVIDGGLSIA